MKKVKAACVCEHFFHPGMLISVDKHGMAECDKCGGYFDATGCNPPQATKSDRVSVSHYLIPGTNLELIDIIHSKMSPAEWRKFCWGSALQYVWRLMDKGEPEKDADKGITYLTWFKEGKP